MPEITKVHVTPGWGDPEHSHIAEIEQADGTREPREDVIYKISVLGIGYWTYGGSIRADVVVRGCPYCTFSDYITTLPDSTTENNLLKLPRF